MMKPDMIVNLIIKQEMQLLSKTDPTEVLSDLIDDEFTEFGSSAQIFDKHEIMRWLLSEDKSERIGMQFKAKRLSDDVMLITYISCIKDNYFAEIKHALRSSIWRHKDGRWRMVFHQGTPIT